MDDEKKKLVEENLDIVKWVILKNIKIHKNVEGLEYDDLYQIGCLALCKATDTYDKTVSCFNTYASIVVRNVLIDHCRKIARNNSIIDRIRIDKQNNFLDIENTIPDENNQFKRLIDDLEFGNMINHGKINYSGVALKGVEALELKVKGYSGKEIAQLYGVNSNHVGAWISKAIKMLKQEKIINSKDYS